MNRTVTTMGQNMKLAQMHKGLITLCAALCSVALPVLAQSAAMPSVGEIVGKLNAARSANTQDKRAPNTRRTRGIEFVEDSAAANEQTAGGTVATAAATSRTDATTSSGVSENRIQFEFNSDRLTPFAQGVVDVFAAAVQSESLRSVNFIIEGHTDGVGSDAYNLELSRKRADAVVRYLVESRGLPVDRFAARGKGKRELANAGEPSAADNRRVVWLPLK